MREPADSHMFQHERAELRFELRRKRGAAIHNGCSPTSGLCQECRQRKSLSRSTTGAYHMSREPLLKVAAGPGNDAHIQKLNVVVLGMFEASESGYRTWNHPPAVDPFDRGLMLGESSSCSIP